LNFSLSSSFPLQKKEIKENTPTTRKKNHDGSILFNQQQNYTRIVYFSFYGKVINLFDFFFGSAGNVKFSISINLVSKVFH
jgi:hypothetical protein